MPVAREVRQADPTGVGDAFRAGFLTGLAGGLALRALRRARLDARDLRHRDGRARRSTHLGQEHFLERLADAYGAESADEIEPHIACGHDAVAGPTPRWSDAARRAARRTPLASTSTAGRRPGEDLVGVGADLDAGTLLEAYARRRSSRWASATHGGRADRLVVAGPARHPAAGGLQRQPVAAQGRCGRFEIRVDTDFDEVVAGCADPDRDGRWITPEIVDAYAELHAAGLGALGRDLAGRRARRRPLRRRDRRPVRGGVDVPRRRATPRRSRSSAWSTCSSPTATRAGWSTCSGRHRHLATLGRARGAARRVPRDPARRVLSAPLRRAGPDHLDEVCRVVAPPSASPRRSGGPASGTTPGRRAAAAGSVRAP